MINRKVDELIQGVPELEETGKQVAQAIHTAVLEGGEDTRNVADFLHGVWLGHPLHPMLTDVTVGGWMLGSLADLLSLFSRSKELKHAADALTTIGTVSAIPTALSGLTDYSTIPKPAAGTGFAHGLLNSVALTFYILSMQARKRGNRGRARFFSLLGVLVASASAYLGGHLVFDKNVGVKHGGEVKEPVEWTTVMADDKLAEGDRLRKMVAGNPVLLYRHNQEVLAVGAVCPHAGGPLEEGQFRGPEVQCPWHDSVFDLRDGCVVHGPSAYALPLFETRVQDGQIEVRLVE
jgi:nitrite reductase/ring-hydroxylating ferredoxin subunit